MEEPIVLDRPSSTQSPSPTSSIPQIKELKIQLTPFKCPTKDSCLDLSQLSLEGCESKGIYILKRNLSYTGPSQYTKDTSRNAGGQESVAKEVLTSGSDGHIRKQTGKRQRRTHFPQPSLDVQLLAEVSPGQYMSHEELIDLTQEGDEDNTKAMTKSKPTDKSVFFNSYLNQPRKVPRILKHTLNRKTTGKPTFPARATQLLKNTLRSKCAPTVHTMSLAPGEKVDPVNSFTIETISDSILSDSSLQPDKEPSTLQVLQFITSPTIPQGKISFGMINNQHVILQNVLKPTGNRKAVGEPKLNPRTKNLIQEMAKEFILANTGDMVSEGTSQSTPTQSKPSCSVIPEGTSSSSNSKAKPRPSSTFKTNLIVWPTQSSLENNTSRPTNTNVTVYDEDEEQRIEGRTGTSSVMSNISSPTLPDIIYIPSTSMANTNVLLQSSEEMPTVRPPDTSNTSETELETQEPSLLDRSILAPLHLRHLPPKSAATSIDIAPVETGVTTSKVASSSLAATISLRKRQKSVPHIESPQTTNQNTSTTKIVHELERQKITLNKPPPVGHRTSVVRQDGTSNQERDHFLLQYHQRMLKENQTMRVARFVTLPLRQVQLFDVGCQTDIMSLVQPGRMTEVNIVEQRDEDTLDAVGDGGVTVLNINPSQGSHTSNTADAPVAATDRYASNSKKRVYDVPIIPDNEWVKNPLAYRKKTKTPSNADAMQLGVMVTQTPDGQLVLGNETLKTVKVNGRIIASLSDHPPTILSPAMSPPPPSTSPPSPSTSGEPLDKMAKLELNEGNDRSSPPVFNFETTPMDVDDTTTEIDNRSDSPVCLGVYEQSPRKVPHLLPGVTPNVNATRGSDEINLVATPNTNTMLDIVEDNLNANPNASATLDIVKVSLNATPSKNAKLGFNENILNRTPGFDEINLNARPNTNATLRFNENNLNAMTNNQSVNAALSVNATNTANNLNVNRTLCNVNIQELDHATKVKAYVDWVNCIRKDCFSGNMPIHVAAMKGDCLALERQCYLLKARKVSLDMKNNASKTALHLAILANHTKAVTILTRFGARLELADERGNNAIHLCVSWASVKCLEVLIASARNTAKMPINFYNQCGYTPLHLCSVLDKSRHAQLLLDYNAMVDLMDLHSGRTALFLAVEHDRVEMVEILLKAQAKPMIPNYAGQTALLLMNESMTGNPAIRRMMEDTISKLRVEEVSKMRLERQKAGLSKNASYRPRESRVFTDFGQSVVASNQRIDPVQTVVDSFRRIEQEQKVVANNQSLQPIQNIIGTSNQRVEPVQNVVASNQRLEAIQNAIDSNNKMEPKQNIAASNKLEPVQNVIASNRRMQPVQNVVASNKRMKPVQNVVISNQRLQPVQNVIASNERMQPVQNVVASNPRLQPVQNVVASNQRMQPVQNVIASNQILEPLQNVVASNQRMQPVQNVVTSNQRLQPVQNVVTSSQRLQPVQNIVTSSQRLQPVQNVVTSSERLQPVQNVVTSSERLQPVQNVVTSSQRSETTQKVVASNKKMQPIQNVIAIQKGKSNTNTVGSYECWVPNVSPNVETERENAITFQIPVPITSTARTNIKRPLPKGYKVINLTLVRNMNDQSSQFLPSSSVKLLRKDNSLPTATPPPKKLTTLSTMPVLHKEGPPVSVSPVQGQSVVANEECNAQEAPAQEKVP